MVINDFLKGFAACLKYHIRYVDTKHGRRYLLMDVLKSGYPQASEATLHKMAIDVVFRFGEDRLHGHGGDSRKMKKRSGDTR